MKNLDCFLFDFQDNTKRVHFPGTAVDDGGMHEEGRWLSYRDLHSVRWQPAHESLMPLVAAALLGVDEKLACYVESEVIPKYASFDKAHREDHARDVVQRALALTQYYDVDRNMLYAAAACHDLGLCAGREVHHLESGRIIRADTVLRSFFSAGQIETIACAAEDHRASAKSEPRSIYGRMVAEADRLIVPESIIRRTVQFGLSHHPELAKEGHWERTIAHLKEKYAEGGYLKLWIPESDNAGRLEELRGIIRDSWRLRLMFERLYAEETGTPRLIRRALKEDLDSVLSVVDAARGIMRANGNMGQWTNGYPTADVLLGDIGSGFGHVVEDEGRTVGYFALMPSPEPSYAEIHGGTWAEERRPYHVIHRIASYPEVHGILSSVLDFCSAVDGNIRIDTHRDNGIMRYNLEKHGFTYRGIIYLLSGDERLAFQRVL